MKILHIVRGLGLGGAENHLMTLLSGLRQQGVDARLLLFATTEKPADDILADCQQRGIPVERWLEDQFFTLSVFRKLTRYLREMQPDCVHTHLIHAETMGILAARVARVRCVVNSCHNDDPFRRKWPLRLRAALLWRLCNGGIAISGYLKDFLTHVEFAPEHKIEVIRYGYTPSETDTQPRVSLKGELGLASDTILIGSVCRLVEQKGLRYALDAFAQLANDYPHVHYVIIGEGVGGTPLDDQLKAQAHELGLAERVHFLGWRSDAASLMAQFDMFLAPSLWEGFGLVFLEAMAHRLPIISTSVSAIPEVVVHEETGLLVPPRNATAIARAMKRLLDHPAEAQGMGQNGLQRLQTEFAPQRMIEQTLAFYQKHGVR